MTERWPNLKTDPKLLDLLERARNHTMTPAELRAQTISFVYGQMMDCSPHITKAQIAAAYDRKYGPIRPAPVSGEGE